MIKTEKFFKKSGKKLIDTRAEMRICFIKMSEKRILIVDDSNAIREILKLKLSKARILFDTATTFEEARQKISERENRQMIPYFAALVDLNLPDSIHNEALEYILQKEIPCIVLSGNPYPDLKDKSLEIVDYINKTENISFDYAVFLIKRLMQTRGSKAIVLNDSSFQSKIIRQYLEVLGFSVTTTESADETIRLVEELSPKLLITDYIIKDGNSYSMIAKLRKKYSIAELIIIALTGSTQTDLSVQLLKVGANDFLQKPFQKEEFNKRVLKEIEIQFMLSLQKRNLKRFFHLNAVLHIHPDGSIIKASEGFLYFFDISSEEISQMNFYDLVKVDEDLTKNEADLGPIKSIKNTSLPIKNNLHVDIHIYDNTNYGMEFMVVILPNSI